MIVDEIEDADLPANELTAQAPHLELRVLKDQRDRALKMQKTAMREQLVTGIDSMISQVTTVSQAQMNPAKKMESAARREDTAKIRMAKATNAA